MPKRGSIMLCAGGLLCGALLGLLILPATDAGGSGSGAATRAAAQATEPAAPFDREAPALVPDPRGPGMAGAIDAGPAPGPARSHSKQTAEQPGGTLADRIRERLPRAFRRAFLDVRMARIRRERRARARFDQAVSEHQVRASQLHPAVKELFESMELEPALDARGELLGLDIESLAPGSPMHGAGFRPADRITRIAGTRLRDPAQLPPLLARLGTRIDFCAARAGEELCREIILD